MSIKGTFFHILLRYRHLLQGKLRREKIDKNTSIARLRTEAEASAARLKRLPEGVRFEAADYEGCRAEWVVPVGAPPDKLVLYFHGGGFVMGSAQSHRGIVAGFMRRLGCRALVFDYRLAPEHPAPAAVEDGAAIYSWLLGEGYRPENIAFAGDSSGGGIQVGTLLKLKDEGLPLPAVCAAFSPCVDMTIAGESHRTRAKADPCTPPGMTDTYLGYYIGDGDPCHPYASPLFGDLAGLPPLIIQVGNDETLRDDSVRLAQKAGQAGVEVVAKVWPGMFHCFPLLAPMFPEATQALEEVCVFMRDKLKL